VYGDVAAYISEDGVTAPKRVGAVLMSISM